MRKVAYIASYSARIDVDAIIPLPDVTRSSPRQAEPEVAVRGASIRKRIAEHVTIC